MPFLLIFVWNSLAFKLIMNRGNSLHLLLNRTVQLFFILFQLGCRLMHSIVSSNLSLTDFNCLLVHGILSDKHAGGWLSLITDRCSVFRFSISENTVFDSWRHFRIMLRFAINCFFELDHVFFHYFWKEITLKKRNSSSRSILLFIKLSTCSWWLLGFRSCML